jgi:hypothetical protein
LSSLELVLLVANFWARLGLPLYKTSVTAFFYINIIAQQGPPLLYSFQKNKD